MSMYLKIMSGWSGNDPQQVGSHRLFSGVRAVQFTGEQPMPGDAEGPAFTRAVASLQMDDGSNGEVTLDGYAYVLNERGGIVDVFHIDFDKLHAVRTGPVQTWTEDVESEGGEA